MNENNRSNQEYRLSRPIIAVLIISLIFNVVTYFRVYSLRQEIRNMQSNIDMISTSINRSVSSSTNQIKEMLSKEASLISEFKYEFGDYKDKRIDILLSVKPKTLLTGDKLYFSYKAGNESPVLIEAKSVDNINFESKINVSIMDNIDMELVIDNGESRKTEKLESLYRPADRLARQLAVNWQHGYMKYNKTKHALVVSDRFELSDVGNDISQYIISDVKLSIVVNDKEIASEPLKYIDNNSYSIELNNFEIPIKAGGHVVMYITAKDNKGTSYSALVKALKIREDGSIDKSEEIEKLGRIEIK